MNWQKKIILWLGVAATSETVLKVVSIRKVENNCSKEMHGYQDSALDHTVWQGTHKYGYCILQLIHIWY